jgi:hypothetical protein
MAQPQYKTMRQTLTDFSGGLRQLDNPLMLKLGQATDLNNVNCHNAPVLETRLGRAAFSTDPTDEGVYLGQFRTQAGRYFLIRGIGSTGALTYWDGTTWQSVGSMTAYQTIYSVSYPTSDIIIFGDGTLMKKWDGTTFADLGGSPEPLINLEVHLSRVWGSTNLVELHGSAGNTAEDWTTENDRFNTEINTSNGDPITALKSYGRKLFIWTQGSMWALLGDGPWNFDLVEVDPNAGCYSHFSVVQLNNRLYWYGPDGVWEYALGTKPRLISRNMIDDIIADVDPNEVSKISAGTDGVQMRLSLPGVTQDKEVVYDPRYGSWWVNDDHNYTRYLYWRRP